VMVVVGGDAIKELDCAASNTSYWLREALVHSGFQPAGIERIKVGVERRVSL
jgi:hypothetical protein